MIEKYRHPVVFYVLATIVPWSFWFLSAYISHISPSTKMLDNLVSVFAIIGLCSPAIVAFAMIGANPSLRNDLASRTFNWRIKPLYIFLTLFLMLGSILLAQAVSLLFGYSAEQFVITGHTSFSGGSLPGWFWILFAPFVEELAWHSYGTDCLRQRMNLLKTCLLFAIYWAFWHYPLFFVKGYYHSNLEEIGIIHSINFMVSIIPFVIIMNWLYYKTRRNLLVPIVFHITAGLFNEMFNTAPDSKIIQTVLLTIFAVLLIMRDKAFFFGRAYDEDQKRGIPQT